MEITKELLDQAAAKTAELRPVWTRPSRGLFRIGQGEDAPGTDRLLIQLDKIRCYKRTDKEGEIQFLKDDKGNLTNQEDIRFGISGISMLDTVATPKGNPVGMSIKWGSVGADVVTAVKRLKVGSTVLFLAHQVPMANGNKYTEIQAFIADPVIAWRRLMPKQFEKGTPFEQKRALIVGEYFGGTIEIGAGDHADTDPFEDEREL